MHAAPFRRLAAVCLTAVCSTAVFAALPAAAHEPYLVRDVNPEPGPALGSDPGLTLVDDGGSLFFFAADPDHGREPWITDGTAGGTHLLRDVCPGACGSAPRWQWSLGDRLLFTVETGLPFGESRLWASDGTWRGTVPLGGGTIQGFPLVGALEDRGLYFFRARLGQNDGLWVTDGTPAGTRRLGASGADGWPLSPYGFSAGLGRLFFGAFRPATGFELWVSDGTEAGTRLVADLAPGPDSSRPTSVWQLPFGAVFTTDFATPCTSEVWVSDGSAAGTRSLAGFVSPTCSGRRVTSTQRVGDAVYFLAQDGDEPRQVWRTDGTAAGTRSLTSFDHGALGTQLSPSDQGVFFAADDGVHGFEPWFAGAGGARMIADLCPGACSSSPGFAQWLGGRFYFAADDGVHGVELWSSDGTEAGTRLVHDACPGGCGSSPGGVAAAGGRIFFGTVFTDPPDFDRALWATADGGGAVRLADLPPAGPVETQGFSVGSAPLGDLLLFAGEDPERGRELWRSDGTPEGTFPIEDARPGRAAGTGSNPHLVTPWAGGVFFVADDGAEGFQPWVSDGTEAGTRRLGVVVGGQQPSFPSTPYADPVVLGADVLFLARREIPARTEVWRAPRTAAPALVLELPDSSPGHVAHLARLGDRVAVLASGGSDTPGGVWITDGTAAGTEQLAALRVFDRGVVPPGAAVGELGGRLYFSASGEETRDLELWTTDGTAAGTRLVADLDPDRESDPRDFTALGGQLLFTAESFDHGRELWTTDGTAAGTRMLSDPAPGFRSSEPRRFAAIGARAFYIADDELGFPSLWTTDGTAAGTVPVAEIPFPSLFPFGPPKHAAAGGRYFFLADDEGLDAQLWVSDGSAAGTRSLRHLFPEPGEAIGVWAAGGRVRVSYEVSPAGDQAAGFELWETDGTFAGTRRLVALPHSGFDQPIVELAEAGGLLYFSGDHPQGGVELMAVSTAPPAPCAADGETLCLRDGRFAVRARWRDPRTGAQGTAGALPLPGSDHSGLFWFFDDENVELVVKTLDGGGVNGWFWNFYGALSDVEYRIEVRDTATGRRVEYHNPEGEICGRGDTRAFPARERPRPAPARTPAPAPAPGGSACGGGPGDLCLHGGRFRVEVTWRNHRNGAVGAGTAVPGTDRSGFFWFFDEENIELVVKVLDGRPVNGRFWVFYGALSDVEYTITVTDTETQDTAVYTNPPGEICGRGDTAAF